MRIHEVFAVAAMTVVLFCAGAAFAGPNDANRGRVKESAEPGAMPKERARIMGYGDDDDPRAAAEKRRNLGSDDDVDSDARARKEKQRERKEERQRQRR